MDITFSHFCKVCKHKFMNFCNIKDPIYLAHISGSHSWVVALRTGNLEVVSSNLPWARRISKISKILFLLMRTYLLWALSLTTHVIQVIGRLRIWGQSLKVCGKWIFRTAKSAENKNSVENGSFPHTLQCGKVFPEWQSVEQTKQKCGKELSGPWKLRKLLWR